MSDYITQQETFSKFDDPAADEITRKTIRRMFGIDSRHPPLPADMPAIEKIKIYASAGFAYRCEGTEKDFERLWTEAFPEEKKGSKQ